MSMAQEVIRFNREIQKWAEQNPNRVKVLSQAVCLEGLKRLVMKTPVRTGRARGGWQVIILSHSEFVRAVEDIAEHLDKSGQETIARGLTKIKAMPAFSICEITNCVHYILELEHGHSLQAPGGMLSLTVDELSRLFMR